MEPFKQKDGNRYDKQLEYVDAYLTSVIDRFFNTKKAQTDIEVEKIISAAVARYKGSIKYKDKGVRSVNGMEGIVNVSLYTLRLMEKEPHKAGFNCNFGNAAGTACHGDDFRLSNQRYPKEHVHKISEVSNLDMILHELNKRAASYGKHIHVNQETLDKIACSLRVDLKDIENADMILSMKLAELKQKAAELEDIVTQYRHYLKRIKAVKGL